MKNLIKFFIFAVSISCYANIEMNIYDKDEKINSGFNNCDIKTNGEYFLLQNIIPNINTCFDIGANKGNWSLLVKKVKSDVLIYAFEPNPFLFQDLLKISKNHKKFHPYELGLFDSIGFQEMFCYSKYDELSGIYYRKILEKLINEKPNKISIKTDTIDNFFNEHNINEIDFIKIDTEGAEQSIILGAYESIKKGKIKSFQIEYGGAYEDSKTKFKDIYCLLSSNNFLIFKILPDGLSYIDKWDDRIENYQYCNYFAVLKHEFNTFLKNVNFLSSNAKYRLINK